jgi:hypothetical protein
MLKQSRPSIGSLCAPITGRLFSELVRLSRTSIADDIKRLTSLRERTRPCGPS